MSKNNKPGNKNSKLAAFEEIDFALYADNDKTISFMSNEVSMPLWLICLKNYYNTNQKEQTTVDLIWSHLRSQRKICAQIKECSFSENGAMRDKLSISFYYSTARVLIQGNKCRQWCTDVFPEIKLLVVSKRKNQEEFEIQSVIKDLCDEDDATREQSPPTEEDKINKPETSSVINVMNNILTEDDSICEPRQKLHQSNEDKTNVQELNSQSVIKDVVCDEDETICEMSQQPARLPENDKINEPESCSHENLSPVLKSNTEVPITTTPRKIKILPTPPRQFKSVSGNILNTIRKLEDENLQLKETIHQHEVKFQQINVELKKQKELSDSLQAKLQELKNNESEKLVYNPDLLELETIRLDLSKETQNREKDKEHNLKDRDNILTRLRILEDQITEINNTNNRSDKLTWETKVQKQIESLTEITESLSKHMNEVQDELFNGVTITRKTPKRNKQTTQNATLPETDVEVKVTSSEENNFQNYKPSKIFRDMKGKGLIFGDSNTKGLQANKLKMRIGSLSGASLDSANEHLKESVNETDNIAQVVIYHLGSNNLTTDDNNTIKSKINMLSTLAQKKYPQANIGMCQIQQRPNVSQERVQDLNNYISSIEGLFLIKNEISSLELTGDRLHYNYKGLASLAKNIKSWANFHGHKPSNTVNFNSQSRGNNSFNGNFREPMTYYNSRDSVYRARTYNPFRNDNNPFRNDIYFNNDKYRRDDRSPQLSYDRFNNYNHQDHDRYQNIRERNEYNKPQWR